MSLDLIGIQNEGEFYTQHYMATLLDRDLKAVAESWRLRAESQDGRTPDALLRGLGRIYFRCRDLWERGAAPEVHRDLLREFAAAVCDALGYAFRPETRELDHYGLIPILAERRKPNGAPELWILEALDLEPGGGDALECELHPCQFPDPPPALTDGLNWDERITKHVFGAAEPPRWLILASAYRFVLIDRTKWNERRLLRFDLGEILGRKDPTTLRATAALLHADSLAPGEGAPLLDTLDENAYKHAHAVSEDLKYALREAIELLGNEAIFYLREVRKEKVFDRGDDLADQLSRECLRTMYRLLFLFYIEARPELGYAPLASDTYRLGYSLERLRDLETVKLTTEREKNGAYLHQSIAMLFRLVFEGYPPAEHFFAQQTHLEGQKDHHAFRMPPLKSHLFDPAKTPLLNRVKIRNHVWQRIIELLSLSRPKKSKRGKSLRRGRVSYARLGINQLGAVYEALLSFRGFFAETDLYEVVRKGERADPLATGYFVKAEDLPHYSEEEKVTDRSGKLVKHAKGRFIYRLAGRDRQRSASYYTPEVLTRCLVNYALRELLRDKTADQILALTLCEPAMGSAAFLNEAINQLAEAYLDRKQRELGRRIAHDAYKRELQRVKMFIADKRVYGVDLNPVAVELAEVSLWLNSISAGGFIPWFGNQLVCGNSLVGARRQVYAGDPLGDRGAWLDREPQRVTPSAERQPGDVYHFLIPGSGMALVNDKVIKAMAPRAVAAMGAWRKAFFRPFNSEQVQTLRQLSTAVDKLWAHHISQRREIWRRTDDPLSVWPGAESAEPEPPRTTTAQKDRILEGELHSKNVRNSSPYRRLKLAMDYWCALWFWPIEHADLLPGRDAYLLELSMLLLGDVYQAQVGEGEQMPLFSETQSEDEARALVDAFGFVNVDALCEKYPRLKLVAELAERYRFLHWELEFADLFAARGGFDLVIGNPPWIKVEWNEGGVMGDAEPLFVLHKYSASKLAAMREEVLDRDPALRAKYFAEYEAANGTQNFLNAGANYPLLRGVQTNLYKCFLPQAWMIGSRQGVAAFVHPEGVYDDPKGGALREAIYPRLKFHFHFHNELKLFHDVHHVTTFSANVFFCHQEPKTSFLSIANLYAPTTVDLCLEHPGTGQVPGIKNDRNKWNTDGHRARVVSVDQATLALFAKLYDPPGTPALQARLPSLHAMPLIGVLRKFAEQPRRLADLEGTYYTSEMWHETNAQKDGTIRRETRFPHGPGEWVLSGPHFYVATPFNKTPRAVCTANGHYDVLDLTALPADYLPRTNYVPACEPAEYRRRTPRVPWNDQKPVTEFYRLVSRTMLSQSGERTLVSAIMPKGAAHLDLGFSITFQYQDNLLMGAAFFASLPYDFFVKSTGKGHFRNDIASVLPFPEPTFGEEFNRRILALNALSNDYDQLNETDIKPIKTSFARRQALVEIDVLAAMALGLTLEELKTIYRIQFPVLRQYEQDTWYDRNGRIVFTVNKGLPGVGLPRKGNAKRGVTGWEDVRGLRDGTVTQTIGDDTLPGGPRERVITYEAPFERCDREADYETAWAAFTRRFGEEAAP